MLEFVGLGLYDERSITQRGAQAISVADTVYLEAYTSVLAGATVDELEAHHGCELTMLDRSTIEQTPDEILDRAQEEHVVMLVGGDPMVATTHVDLRLRAVERDIETSVIHGTSAATAAAGLCGLQARRFGKATTVPHPGQFGDDGVPPSVIETIDDNHERGLHTMVYLDIKLGDATRESLSDELEDRCLDAGTAAAELERAVPDLLAVAVGRAGSDDPLVVADRVSALAGRDFGPPLHLLIIPGRLHDLEAQALLEFADAPKAAVDELRQ